MAGYAALGRIEGGRVRTLAWSRSAAEDLLLTELHRVAAVPEEPGRPLDEVIRERWTVLREELSMMTFFLLDPESWR